MKKYLLSLAITIVFLLSGREVLATEKSLVTLVNPVRSRELWKDKSLETIREQYKIAEDREIRASWLIQYDVLKDEELLKEIKSFENQEIGLFLEVSKKMAEEARVVYPVNKVWYSPEVVFLSAYSRMERIKLIYKAMEDFKLEFGEYPKSVGAWWIDSYSLGFLRDVYEIETVLICADQKTTDNYGIWGQWWSVPYFPSKYNILEPAKNERDKNGVTLIQWAMRDPVEAYKGEGKEFSNHSVQANDYLSLGKDINYFKKLAEIYLGEERNEIRQLTIGLEVGQEGVGNLKELERQVDYLLSGGESEFLGMEEFAKRFNESYPEIRKEAYVGSWVMNTKKRENRELGEYREYRQEVFSDYFVADKGSFLQREINKNGREERESRDYYWIVALGIGASLFFVLKREWFLEYLLWVGLSAGLWLRSGIELGWKIDYGYWSSNLEVEKAVVVIVASIIFWRGKKLFKEKGLWLSFGLWPVVRLFRYSVIEGKKMIGFLLDSFRFVGIEVGNEGVRIVNKDLVGWQAETMLKFKMEWLWEKGILMWVGISMAQIVMSVLIIKILKKLPKRASKIIRIVLGILVTVELLWVLSKGIERVY